MNLRGSEKNQAIGVCETWLLAVHVRVPFWDLYSVPFIFSVSVSVPDCFDDHWPIVYLEVCIGEPNGTQSRDLELIREFQINKYKETNKSFHKRQSKSIFMKSTIP